MNTFDKIRHYYSKFEEWDRLDSPAGVLEREETLRIVRENVPLGSRILDLGSGPGRYAAEFVKEGYKVTLLDLSPDLIRTAQVKFNEMGLSAEGFWVGNAIDLSIFEPGAFDAVFSCGPFYHLVNAGDREKAAREIKRVCRKKGKLVIGVMPRFSGLAGLIQRAASNPIQITAATIKTVSDTGVFHNAADLGFQEGYYPTLNEVLEFWEGNGVEEIAIQSTRTFMYQNEEAVIKIRDLNPEVFDAILESSRKFSKETSFIEAGGHALMVATNP